MSDTAVTNGENPSSPGVRLRAAREAKGLTLDDAAKTTRIAKVYLKALEDDDYAKLPSEAYTRGFLRSYAAFLGLPYGEVGFSQPVNNDGREIVNGTHGASDSGSYHSLPHKVLPVIQAVLPLLLVATVVAAVLLLFFPARRPVLEENVSVPSPAPVLKESPASSVAVPGPALVVDPLPEKPVSAESAPRVEHAVERPEGLVLKLRALVDGALAVTIDEAVTERYVLKAGDNIELKAMKYIALDLENAGGVEAELNGKALNPFGEAGEAARAVLTVNQ